ncbi:MAG: ABC transporter permease [Propioniciclava sp.]|uniref:ABC transporter permease n=1 Tax=Propioniciclava sp. TaxID=2038686 RepID=UPI0039E70744
MKTRAGLLVLPGMLILVAGLIVPAIAFLFFPRGSGPGQVFAAFAGMFSDPFMLAIHARTIWIGLVVTALCILLGFPIAYMLARSNSRWVGMLLALAIFPLLLSNVVRTFGWLVVLGSQGVLGRLLTGLGLVETAPQLLASEFAIVLGLIQLFLPLSIISSYSAIAQVEPTLDEAARSLGAGPIRTFWSVVVPLSMPGVIVAATLVFAGACTAYTTPYLLGGSSDKMLSTQLFYYTDTNINWTMAAAVAMSMTILVFAVSSLSSVAGRLGRTQ